MSTLDARDNLNHIAHHWADLQHQLGGLKSTPTDKITVKSSSDPQAPINLHVLVLIETITRWAREAAAHLAHDEGIYAPTTGTIATLRHLARNKHYWDHEPEFAHQARSHRNRLDAAINNKPGRNHLGPCPGGKGEDKDGCGEIIWAPEDTDAGTCPACGTEWTYAAQYEWLKSELDSVLMTQTELHIALNRLGHDVKPGTIWSWVSRKRLVPVEEGLFRLAHAIDLATKKRTTAA